MNEINAIPEAETLKLKTIPVIDLFAGPGGLAEGFSSISYPDGRPVFRIRLSIEKDPFAHQTLTLRNFYRQFPKGCVPDEYYDHLRNPEGFSARELFKRCPAEAEAAKEEAWNIELGEKNSEQVDRKIARVLNGETDWLLIGGPPCQAYSLAGRARMPKNEARELDKNDTRVFLYKEYLRIIARHSPAVFVMENVKGLLSSKVDKELIFSRILRDLSEPYSAFSAAELDSYPSHRYTIHSLVVPPRTNLLGETRYENDDFIIKSEDYGIPQARHRVILLGLRDDLNGITPGVLEASNPVSLWQVIGDLPELRSGISTGSKFTRIREFEGGVVKDDITTWKKLIRSQVSDTFLNEVKELGEEELCRVLENNLNNLITPVHDKGAEFIPLICRPSSLSGWFLDEKLEGVCNHTTRPHIPQDLLRYLFASTFAQVKGRSPKLSDFPAVLLPNHKNIDRNKVNQHFADRFRVQLPARPSSTVTSHLSKDGHFFIHPDPAQCRSMTVREAARLQTFPDNYFFCGSRTAQYIQVGNAVPPLLARQIAAVVQEVFTAHATSPPDVLPIENEPELVCSQDT